MLAQEFDEGFTGWALPADYIWLHCWQLPGSIACRSLSAFECAASTRDVKGRALRPGWSVRSLLKGDVVVEIIEIRGRWLSLSCFLLWALALPLLAAKGVAAHTATHATAHFAAAIEHLHLVSDDLG